jgi:hypothetical protein
MPSKHTQAGAISIEFAAVFMLFFAMIYAVIAYALPLLLVLTLKQLSADAARAAVRVDPAQDDSQYAARVSQQVDAILQQTWLPDDWYQGGCPAPNNSLPWQPLPAASNGQSYGYLGVDSSTLVPGHVLHVCLQRPYNQSGSTEQRAIIPIINLLGLQIPSLPSTDGQTILRGQTTTRL